MRKSFITILSFALLLVSWQLISWLVAQPELVPGIFTLFRAISELLITPDFYLSVGTTVLRGVTGICISFLLALFSAILFSRHEWIYELCRPLFILMRSVPVVSFILLALIFLNPESIPLIIAFLTMYPLLTENLTKGINTLQSGYAVMARQFRIRRLNYLLQVIYPQVKPFLFSGLATAMGFGWRAIIMGEVLAQCSLGIGSEMKQAQVFIAVPELLAWTIVAVLVSLMFDKLISKLGTLRFPVWFSDMTDKQNNKLQGSDIKITDMNFGYGESLLFERYNYVFEKGKIYGISSPSGSGKTTLLQLINVTLTPSGGTIQADRTHGIASVFQYPQLLPGLTVAENCILPLAGHTSSTQAIQTATRLLEQMEMEDYRDSYPGELSYGQQQRVSIARALAYPSPYLLMDEPFKGLDEELKKRIISYIKQHQKDIQQTVIFTSHNPQELELLADKIILSL